MCRVHFQVYHQSVHVTKLHVVFAEIRPTKPKKNKIKTMHVFGSAIGFGSVSISAHM